MDRLSPDSDYTYSPDNQPALRCDRCQDADATTERHGEPLCASCADTLNERAYERSLSGNAGGTSPATEHERNLAAHQAKRENR